MRRKIKDTDNIRIIVWIASMISFAIFMTNGIIKAKEQEVIIIQETKKEAQEIAHREQKEAMLEFLKKEEKESYACDYLEMKAFLQIMEDNQ